MKKISFFLCAFILVIHSGCKKDDSSSSGSTSYPDKIILNPLQTSNDSVVLTWSKLNNSAFSNYTIQRRNYKASNPASYNYSDIVQVIEDKNVVTCADRSVPALPYLEYQVVAYLYDPVTHSGNEIYSNVISFERTDLKSFSFNPSHIIPDIADHRIYVIEPDSGKISILDYSTRTMVKTITTNSTIGYSDLGTYNGVKELYVPRNDGWVFIYNAETLDKIDQIYSSSGCGTVLYNNGQLFVSSTNEYNNTVNVYNRSTKAILSTVGNLQNMRLRLVPGSTTKMYGISSQYYYNGELYYLEFNAAGQLVKNLSNYVNSSTDFHSFQVFPDGKHFITSETGTIFNDSLAFESQLPYGTYEFVDFAFTQNASTILAGCSNYKRVIAYANPGYSESHTYSTNGYPEFFFVDNNSIISLSSVTPVNSFGYTYSYIIENIPLSK
jgi:hypothetical protein